MLKCLVLCLVLSVALGENRKVSLFINPGCSDCDQDKNILIHVTAEGQNDTLHHIWDFTYKPTILLALTPVNTSLTINWNGFRMGEIGAVNFSSKPTAAFSFTFDQLIEFNDVNNSVIYDPSLFNETSAHIQPTQELEWKVDRSKLKNLTEVASLALDGRYPRGKGIVTISLSAFGSVEHSQIQPHLLHSVNTSQVDVALSGLPSTDGFKSRYALALSLATEDPAFSSAQITQRKSLDDEHSPGVFKIGEVKTLGGYMLWRDVAYTSSERLQTKSTLVKPALYPLSSNSTFDRTVVGSLFGDRLDSMLTRKTVFSFGQAGADDFYPVSSYLSWTFLGGLGEPVDDSYSLLVQFLTIFGISLPIVALLCGAIWLLFKRIHSRTHDIVFAEN